VGWVLDRNACVCKHGYLKTMGYQIITLQRRSGTPWLLPDMSVAGVLGTVVWGRHDGADPGSE
jgi:hypothetical protein